MAINLINSKTKSGLDSAISNGSVKDTDIAFCKEAGYEKIRTQGKDFVCVPSGYEGAEGLFLQSDGIKPIWKTYSPPVEYKWYGVRWAVDSKDPHLERIGSFDMHQSLPIQSQLKACVVQTKSDGTKTKQYDLDPDDWDLRLDAPEIKATGTVTYDSTSKVASGTINITKGNFADIPNIESATNRLVGHYIQIVDKFDAKQKFKMTAVEDGDTTWNITVEANLDDSGIYTSPFTCYLGSDRTGYDGQVMADVPSFYLISETNVVSNGKKYNQVKISSENLGNTWTHEPARYDSVYKITVLNTVPENMGYLSTLPVNSAVSIANTATYCRGGGNRTDYDKYFTDDNGSAAVRSDLGKHRTNTSRTNMRKYCRNAGIEIMNYYQYKSLYWLWVIEYANFNSQEAFNATLTAGGLHQGGMGNGITNMQNWEPFNGNCPVMPNGYLDSLGSTTGVKQLQIPVFSITTSKVTFSNITQTPQHQYQANAIDKVTYRTNASWKVTNGNTITYTAVRYNGNATGFGASQGGGGTSSFHAEGLTGDIQIRLNTGGKTYTFTSENQATVQTIQMGSGFNISIYGYKETKDAGGHTIVDPTVGDSTNISLICDSSEAGSISYNTQTVIPFRWRVYDNLFGDTWNILDGIVIDASNDTGGSYNTVYATRDVSKYCKADGSEHDRTSMSQMSQVGKEIHLEGWTTEFDLGTEGNIFPVKHNGGSNQGMCDYHYVGSANDNLRTFLVGGYAGDGMHAGLAYFVSNYSTSAVWAPLGFRASCSK